MFEMYEDQKKKDAETIQNLQNELKNRPEVLNVPPLNTVMGEEAKLHNELKKKEQLIDHLKDEFEHRCREKYIKLIVEIEEYKKIYPTMKKLISKKDELLEGKKIERIIAKVKVKREK